MFGGGRRNKGGLCVNGRWEGDVKRASIIVERPSEVLHDFPLRVSEFSKSLESPWDLVGSTGGVDRVSTGGDRLVCQGFHLSDPKPRACWPLRPLPGGPWGFWGPVREWQSRRRVTPPCQVSGLSQCTGPPVKTKQPAPLHCLGGRDPTRTTPASPSRPAQSPGRPQRLVWLSNLSVAKERHPDSESSRR